MKKVLVVLGGLVLLFVVGVRPLATIKAEEPPVVTEEVIPVVEEEEEVVEKDILTQAIEFFQSSGWVSIVGTLSSGGLVGVLFALLKKNKNALGITTVASKMTGVVAELGIKYDKVVGYVDDVKNAVNEFSKKTDVIIGTLSLAVSGMNVKEEYKVEILKSLASLGDMNKSINTIITTSVDLGEKIIEDKKVETTKEIVEIKNDVTSLANKYLG